VQFRRCDPDTGQRRVVKVHYHLILPLHAVFTPGGVGRRWITSEAPEVTLGILERLQEAPRSVEASFLLDYCLDSAVNVLLGAHMLSELRTAPAFCQHMHRIGRRQWLRICAQSIRSGQALPCARAYVVC
jgi:hypothetical protein